MLFISYIHIMEVYSFKLRTVINAKLKRIPNIFFSVNIHIVYKVQTVAVVLIKIVPKNANILFKMLNLKAGCSTLPALQYSRTGHFSLNLRASVIHSLRIYVS